MREHRAAIQQQLVQQEAEGQHRQNLKLNIDREQVLARLWEIANLSPDMTRGSITGQVKALAMIIAMQHYIPNHLEDRLSLVTEKTPPTAPPRPQIYVSAWRRDQQATSVEPQPGPAPPQQEDPPGVPEPERVPGSEEEAPRDPDSGPSTFATDLNPPQPQPPAPFIPLLTSVPDARAPFSLNRNPFGRRR